MDVTCDLILTFCRFIRFTAMSLDKTVFSDKRIMEKILGENNLEFEDILDCRLVSK